MLLLLTVVAGTPPSLPLEVAPTLAEWARSLEECAGELVETVGSKRKIKETRTFLIKGRQYLVDQRREDAREERSSRNVLSKTLGLNFRLTGVGDESLTVVGQESRHESAADDLESRRQLVDRYILAGTLLFGRPLADELKTIRITRAPNRVGDHWKFEFERPKDRVVKIAGGWIELMGEKPWGVRKFHYRLSEPAGGAIVGEVTYEGELAGFPMVKTATIALPHVGAKYFGEVLKLEKRAIDDREFSIERFGFLDATKPVQSVSPLEGIAWGGAMVLGLIAAGFVARVLRRRAG